MSCNQEQSQRTGERNLDLPDPRGHEARAEWQTVRKFPFPRFPKAETQTWISEIILSLTQKSATDFRFKFRWCCQQVGAQGIAKGQELGHKVPPAGEEGAGKKTCPKTDSDMCTTE